MGFDLCLWIPLFVFRLADGQLFIWLHVYCVRQKLDVLHADIIHGAFGGQKAAPKQKPLRDVSVALGQ